MYPVSEAFLQAVQENTRRYYWSGRITTTKGATYEFGADDIVKGSGYISSQCCGSTEIELGTVYLQKGTYLYAGRNCKCFGCAGHRKWFYFKNGGDLFLSQQ